MNTKPIIFGSLFGLFSLYMTIQALKSIKQFKASLNWPKTSGLITLSEASKTSKNSTYFVNYNYEVNNKSYTGRRATLWPMIPREKEIEFEKTFIIGNIVNVFYDSKNPAEAVLIVGAPEDGKIYGGIVIGLLASIISFAIVIAGYNGILK